MFNKTTSFIFNKYGEIVSEINRRQAQKLSVSTLRLKDKSFDKFYFYDCDVFVKVTSGIVMLVVSNDETAKEYERFVIHRYIKIKKGGVRRSGAARRLSPADKSTHWTEFPPNACFYPLMKAGSLPEPQYFPRCV